MTSTKYHRALASALALMVLVLLGARPPAGAQEVGAPVVVAADTSAYPHVSLLVDLPAGAAAEQAATVLEGGVGRAAEVVRGAGALEVVLVVDTSGSMKGASLVAAKEAAVAFIDRLPEGARMAIVGFGHQPYVVSGLTDDRAALRHGVSGLVAAGETALYDALAVGAASFSGEGVARSIVVVSDGGDTASTKTLPEVTSVLVDHRVRLFGVHLLTSEAQRAVVEQLAAATGGRVAGATDAAQLGTTYAAVAEDVVRQVQVRYESRAHGATAIEVRVGGATASTTLDLPPAPPAPAAPPRPELQAAADRAPSLLLGGACIFMAVFLTSCSLLVPRRRSLLAGSASVASPSQRRLKAKAGELVERRLERRGQRRALGARLENAGLVLRPGEYVVMVGGSTAMAFVFGLVAGGMPLGSVLALAVVLGARVVLSSKTGKRRAELEKQLPDLLQQLTSSLRAGYGVMQAVDAAAREMEEPMAGELRRLFTEVQLGRDLTESLQGLAARMSGQDFEWVVQAIEINREVGGELVEVIEAVATTIRARDHLRRQVKTLSAQGRLSARILLSMPFVMGALLSVMSPGYLAPLFAKGLFLVVVGAVLMLVGWVWTRRLVRAQF